MPKITSIEVQKSSKRFNIYIDGKFGFGADEDLVVDHRLFFGKLIDPADLEKLLFEAGVGKLMQRMYALFDRRLRSEKEIKDYFKNLSFKRKIKGQEEISDTAINLVVEKLKQKKLLNDEEFAKAWVESRSKKRGIKVLKSELYKKGINRDIIEVEAGSLESEQENIAKDLLLKRLHRFKSLPVLDIKRKAYEFLLRKGFEYEIVKEVVEKLMKKEYTIS